MDLSMPVLVAPLAYLAVLHPEAEVGMMRGTEEVGSALCVSAFGSSSPAKLSSLSSSGHWLAQLYPLRDRELQRQVVAGILEARPRAVMVTMDPPVPGEPNKAMASLEVPAGTAIPMLGIRTTRITTARELLEMVESRPSWEDLADIATQISSPLVVKGILDPADAGLACEHGASAIVVSNHGGRHSDGAVASLEALGPVAEEVGERAEVYLDGGVRGGEDVAKALALGAKAVLLGRPAIWALVCGGGAAVAEMLRWLRADLAGALARAGCSGVDSLSSSLVGPAWKET
jgi:4-hydroxymandelate oxidase